MVTPYPHPGGDARTRAVGTGAGEPDPRPDPHAGRTPAQDWRPHLHVPAPGDRLGRYRLDREIGQGGMGIVYLGLDDEHRAVAIKVLKPHIAADPQARQRLAREVSTLERVRSPRVAEVLAADVDGQWPHLVTRYVPGPPLEHVVQTRGPLRGSRLRDLGHGLAEALHAIHAAGVVHRDLKPSNVLVLDGLPVVIDFGIAHVADDVRLTSTGLVMGTPGYLSPEVVAGGLVSPATDWWGWAATVAYAASGRPPFGSGPMEVVLDRVRRADVDLSEVPADLRGPILAALAVNPAHRPHPEALLRALDGATTAPQAHVDPVARTTAVPAPVPPRATPPRSRFESLMADETTDLPRTAQPAAERPAEATSVLPPVRPAPPTTPFAQAGPASAPRPSAQQAPPGWIPRVPGPGPLEQPPRDAPQGWPPNAHPTAAHPAAQSAAQAPPRTGTNGEPARPQRSWTILAALLALVGVFAVAPAAGVLIALVGGTVARTVDRVAAGLFRRRWEAGPRSTDALAVGAATPWHAFRAAVSTVFAAIVPVLVGISVAFILGTFGQGALGGYGSSTTLALSGLAGTLVAWHGPGGRSLQRGARTAIRSALRGERETGIAIGVLLLVASASALMVLGGTAPDWRPLASSPFDWLH
ncbi:serine/threonine-protein kinase [Kineococcus rhizosphaerae]|uniref:Serine/threonine protein kinase n=1 Tax=Kineococcus rhizosphaerae TaxID=559628 RepID=A0A2T0QXX5_9ACTN|nr:serine/threonine-protein kinase [Kineococcus rhizosphaerae]PRY11070.1 serine/threonine protein kinase [Kineococcus rhizosphaerae]